MAFVCVTVSVIHSLHVSVMSDELTGYVLFTCVSVMSDDHIVYTLFACFSVRWFVRCPWESSWMSSSSCPPSSTLWSWQMEKLASSPLSSSSVQVGCPVGPPFHVEGGTQWRVRRRLGVNVANLLIFLFSGLWFYQYLCNRSTFLASNLSLSGLSHVRLLFTYHLLSMIGLSLFCCVNEADWDQKNPPPPFDPHRATVPWDPRSERQCSQYSHHHLHSTQGCPLETNTLGHWTFAAHSAPWDLVPCRKFGILSTFILASASQQPDRRWCFDVTRQKNALLLVWWEKERTCCFFSVLRSEGSKEQACHQQDPVLVPAGVVLPYETQPSKSVPCPMIASVGWLCMCLGARVSRSRELSLITDSINISHHYTLTIVNRCDINVTDNNSFFH